MRLSFFTVGIFACFVAIVAAWSKEDQEIFRLRDEVELSEGVGVSFYDFVGTTPGANQDEINKAYRKRSKVLHPDKVKREFTSGKDAVKGKKPAKAEIEAKAKEASDRFARLGIVTNILRGPGRERYDHFLSNGFPKWKGTGYYYARFRPGLFSVLVGLFIAVGGGGHWIMLLATWKRNQDFMNRYIKHARHAAWGDNLNIPGLDAAAAGPATGGEDSDAQAITRKERRWREQQAKKESKEKKPKGVKAAKPTPSATPAPESTGARKRVTAENGKTLIVDSIGNVFLEQANEDGEYQEFLLDPNEVHKPTIKDTALVKLPMWAVNSVVGRFSANSATEEDEDSIDEEIDTPGSSGSGAEDFELLEKVKTTAQNGAKAVRRKKSSTRGK